MGDHMVGLHRNRAVLRTACLSVGLGICSSTFGQTLKTENFDDDPGWIGVNNTQFDEPVHTDGANGFTNFGFSNTDNTGTTPNPPGGTATAAGEAGGGFANNPGF